MTSHSLDPNKMQKMSSHSLQPSSRQFVGPLRSSSFGRDARWNLNLGSRFSTRESRKKRERKKTRSRKLSQGISSATFVSRRNRDRDRGIRKVDGQSRREATRFAFSTFVLRFSNRISWNRLPRGNAPTRPETVTTCPALPTYNKQTRQKYATYPAWPYI